MKKTRREKNQNIPPSEKINQRIVLRLPFIPSVHRRIWEGPLMSSTHGTYMCCISQKWRRFIPLARQWECHSNFYFLLHSFPKLKRMCRIFLLKNHVIKEFLSVSISSHCSAWARTFDHNNKLAEFSKLKYVFSRKIKKHFLWKIPTNSEQTW